MSLKALLTGEFTQSLRIRGTLVLRTYATASDSAKEEILDITSVDEKPKYKDDVPVDEQHYIELQRNKSRLNQGHQNILKGIRPYEDEGPAYHHYSIEWKRKMFGRYGIEGSGVPPGVAWPTKEAIADAKEYEKVAYPQSLQDSWAQIAAEKAEKAAKIQAREDDILAKLAKTGQWEKELIAKIAKKENELRAAKEHKERIVEEVRRHFGFKVDPRDERFRQMLEQKEKEDKKRRKEAKKKERNDKIMARLLSGSEGGSTEAKTDNNTKSSTPKDLS